MYTKKKKKSYFSEIRRIIFLIGYCTIYPYKIKIFELFNIFFLFISAFIADYRVHQFLKVKN